MRAANRASAAARAGVLLAVLVLAGCGAEATPGPSAQSGSGAPPPGGLESPGSSSAGSQPPGSPTAASPSPGPSSGPAAPALQANIAAKVLVSGLNVRQSPSTSAKKVGSLSKGDVVVLLGYGGLKVGGYVWFEAARIKGLHGPLPALPADPTAGGTWSDMTGWIATGSGSTPWIEALPARCDPAAATDLGLLSAMLPGEALACLGTSPLTLQGTFGCGGCGGAWPGTFSPSWLAPPSLGFLSVDARHPGPLALYFPSGVTQPAPGSIVKVKAHLSDGHSTSCKISIPASDAFDAPLVAIRSADAVRYCRQHIVVDSLDVLGTDPSFQPG